MLDCMMAMMTLGELACYVSSGLAHRMDHRVVEQYDFYPRWHGGVGYYGPDTSTTVVRAQTLFDWSQSYVCRPPS